MFIVKIAFTIVKTALFVIKMALTIVILGIFNPNAHVFARLMSRGFSTIINKAYLFWEPIGHTIQLRGSTKKNQHNSVNSYLWYVCKPVSNKK